MSGGGMQGTQGVGTAASGGKGGQMGGAQMPSIGGGSGMTKPAMQGGGGKGGGDPQGVTGGGTPAMKTLTPSAYVSQKENAFDQGLGGMDLAMNWMQDAMGSQSPTLNGDYTVGGIDPNKYLGKMGQAGGGGYTAAMMEAPGKELYDYNPALAQGATYDAAQLSDKDINEYMNPYTQNSHRHDDGRSG